MNNLEELKNSIIKVENYIDFLDDTINEIYNKKRDLEENLHPAEELQDKMDFYHKNIDIDIKMYITCLIISFPMFAVLVKFPNIFDNTPISIAMIAIEAVMGLITYELLWFPTYLKIDKMLDGKTFGEAKKSIKDYEKYLKDFRKIREELQLSLDTLKRRLSDGVIKNISNTRKYETINFADTVAEGFKLEEDNNVIPGFSLAKTLRK